MMGLAGSICRGLGPPAGQRHFGSSHIRLALPTPPACLAACLQQSSPYIDQLAITQVEERCPAEDYADSDPFPLPPFVPHNQVTPDIYPGE